MREEGWGQPPKVFSAWWGGVSTLASSSQKSAEGARWGSGQLDMGTWGRGDWD